MLQSNQGYLFILGAAMLFGTTGTAQAFAPEGMSPAFTGALRLAIGGPVLLALTASGNRPRLAVDRKPARCLCPGRTSYQYSLGRCGPDYQWCGVDNPRWVPVNPR